MTTSGKCSLRTILSQLTPRGLVSRNGKAMGPSALRAMLRNPFYTGRIRYCGVLVPGRHEALIDDDLFCEVLLMLSKRG